MKIDFLNHLDQINRLKSKGLAVSDDDVFILERENYYTLVNGYKQFFQASTNPFRFNKNTTLRDVYNLYEFDRELRYIHLLKILKIEKALASIIAYTFCSDNKDIPDAYLIKDNFDTIRTAKPLKKERGKYRKVQLRFTIDDFIENTLKKKYNNDKIEDIKRCKEEHKSVPLCILIYSLTLGELTMFFTIMKPEQQRKVADYFNNTYNKEYKTGDRLNYRANKMIIFLESLTNFRNICAYNKQLFCVNNEWGIKNIYELRNKFKEFLLASEYVEFVNRIKNLFTKYSKEKRLGKDRFALVKQHMGYHEN